MVILCLAFWETSKLFNILLLKCILFLKKGSTHNKVLTSDPPTQPLTRHWSLKSLCLTYRGKSLDLNWKPSHMEYPCRVIIFLLCHCLVPAKPFSIMTYGLHHSTFWPAIYEYSNFCTSLPIPSFSFFLKIVAILVGVRSYFMKLFNCCSQTTYDSEHLLYVYWSFIPLFCSKVHSSPWLNFQLRCLYFIVGL